MAASWFSRLFGRSRTARPEPKPRSRWAPPRLALERLEDRLAPATFAENGALLKLDLNAAGEAVNVVSGGTSYTLTLTGGTWSGTDSANVTGNGTATLTVTAAGLAAFDRLDLHDSAANTAVTFDDSGANGYSDAFAVTLDDAAAGPITFNGSSSFGASGLTASTARNIVVNAGASVTTTSGNILLGANRQATPTAGAFRGVMVSGTVQSTSGQVTVSGTGGAGGAVGFNFGVRLDSGGRVISGSGPVFVTGNGGTGSPGGNDGVSILDAGSGVFSTSGDVTVTGSGGSGDAGRNYGVVVEVGGQIASGSGLVNVVGTGGNGGPGGLNAGVYAGDDGTLITSGGAVSVTGTGGAGAAPGNNGVFVTARAQITSTGGPVSVTGTGTDNSAAVRLEDNVAIVAANNTVTVTADSLEIAGAPPGTISAGFGTVILQTRTAGTLIDLGGPDVLGGSPLTLGLSAVELSRIIAGALVIGDAPSGNLTVTAPINVTAGVGTLALRTGGAIADGNAAGTDLTVGSLAMSAASGIGSGDALETGVTNLAAQNFVPGGNASGNIEVANTGALTIGTVGGVAGISNAGGDVVVLSAGDLLLGALVSAAGNALLTAAGGAIVDTNGAATNVMALGAALVASAGIGSGDALETGVTNLAAQNFVPGGNASGNIEVANTGALTIGTVGGVAGISNTGGDVVVSTTGNLAIEAPVTASGSVMLTGGAGNAGSTITLNAAVTGTSARVSGGGGDDTIAVNAVGTSPISLFGLDGNDTFRLANGLALNGGTVNGGTGTDLLDYSAFTTAVQVNLGQSGQFRADLEGEQEVPPNSSAATGQVTLTYNAATRTMDIALTVVGIAATEPNLRFHIHQQAIGANGPIILDLFNRVNGVNNPNNIGTITPTADGFTYAATGVALPAVNEGSFFAGNTYFNIHTTAFPGGEVRGQIAQQAPSAAASGTATGTGGVTDVEDVTGGAGNDSLIGRPGANTLRGLGGNDILVGGQGGDVMLGGADNDLMVWSNGDGSDVMDGEAGLDTVQVNGTTTAGDVFETAAGGTRVAFRRVSPGPFTLDIGTTEVLNQIGHGGGDSFSIANLTGVADLQTINLTGVLGADTFAVANAVTRTNISGGSGDDNVAFANASSLNGGTVNGGSGVDTLDYSASATGVAVNLGVGTTGLTATLEGGQEVPSRVTPAGGTATLSYDATTKLLDISVTVTNLNPATVNGFHLHRGAFGVNGPIIIDLQGLAPLVPSGTGFTFNATGINVANSLLGGLVNEASLLGGLTYLNVHTPSFPAGEVRGQVFSQGNVSLPAGTATGTAGVSNVENAIGSESADGLVGSAAANVLEGRGGNDALVGGPGADTMRGGDGDDILVWSNGDGSDVMDGGAGLDTVQVNGSLTAGDDFTVNAGPGGRLDFDRVSPGPFSLDIGTTETLTVNGIGGDDTFGVGDLAGVADLTALNLNGLAGDDTFNVRPGVMNVNGGRGDNRLAVDAAGTAQPRDVTVTNSLIDGGAGFAVSYRAPDGTFARGVQLTTGGGADQVTVRSTAGPTTLRTGGGGDNITIATTTGPLSTALVGAVTVEGGDGTNFLAVSEAASAVANTVVAGAASFTGLGGLAINYTATGTFGGVSYTGGLAGDTITYVGKLPGQMILDGGGGDDFFGARLTEAIRPDGLVIDGGAGLNVLTVLDVSGGAVVRNIPSGPAAGTILLRYGVNTPSAFAYQNIQQVLGINNDSNYIRALYNNTLGRRATQEDVDFWLGFLARFGRLATARSISQSAEGRAFLVAEWCQMFLGRLPTPGESAPMVQALLAGHSEESVLGQLIGATASRTAGARTTLVNFYYTGFLRRQGAASDVTAWVNGFSPIGNVRLLFLVSEEFFLNGI